MKKLKWCFTILFGFFGMLFLQAQTVVKKPKATIMVTQKKDEKIVVHKGITYYVIEGLWHTKIKNKYTFRSAPKGAVLKELPLGGENVKMAGKIYYKCKGVFYKKVGKVYQVARP